MKQIKLSTGILAGGKSSRMGQNKALMVLEHQRFIDKITKELSGFSEVIISAAHKGIYEDMGFPIVYDEHKEIGPLEGIYQIVSAAKEDYVFICATDMPFITEEVVTYLSEYISSDYDCYCLTEGERVHPLCAIYSKAMLPVLEEMIAEGKYRLLHALDAVRTKYIRLEYTNFDRKVVKNINTKEEYRDLIFPIVACVSAVKNSGKTGLIEKLIQKFVGENYTVGVIKHDGHDYEMDHEGTDTYRFTKAGAVYSTIFSERQFSVNGKKKKSIEEMIQMLSDVNVILIEGMKYAHYPKIEVVRKAISSDSICDPDELICIATDVISQNQTDCPVYGIDDVTGIYLCLKKYFGLGNNLDGEIR